MQYPGKTFGTTYLVPNAANWTETRMSALSEIIAGLILSHWKA
jgi:hypothetical protein